MRPVTGPEAIPVAARSTGVRRAAEAPAPERFL